MVVRRTTYKASRVYSRQFAVGGRQNAKPDNISGKIPLEKFEGSWVQRFSVWLVENYGQRHIQGT